MKRLCLSILTVAIFGASAAQAGNCNWRTPPTNVVFGIYTVLGTPPPPPLSANSNYEFRCSPNTQAVLTFDDGANATSYFPRYMSFGANLVAYNLYDDAGGAVVIGNGTGGTTTRVIFNSSPQNKDYADSIYGLAPQGADVAPGTYTDSVIATLTWDNGTKSISASFTVTTIVQAECTVTTVPIDFGNYDPVGTNAVTPLDNVGGINVLCTVGTTATVSLGNGLNFAGGVRRLAGPGGSFLTYQLYRNLARTNIWSTAPNTVSGTSMSRNQPIGNGLTVYGRVTANQDPLAGLHTDVVQATVNY